MAVELKLIGFFDASVGEISLELCVVFPCVKNVFRGLNKNGRCWTMKSSPSRKYENFSSDHQGKETDKHSLDSQDTASLVSRLPLRIIDFVCVLDDLTID